MSWFQWLRTLFTVQGRLYYQMLQEIEYVKTICLLYALLQLRLEGTKVYIEMHFVPFEDRPSEWMQRAADPFRFERRIQMMEDMLSNVFLKKTFFLHDYIEKI